MTGRCAATDTLHKIFPKFETRQIQCRAIAVNALAIYQAMVFILIEDRGGLAANNVSRVD
jgi:hypothetical protein